MSLSLKNNHLLVVGPTGLYALVSFRGGFRMGFLSRGHLRNPRNF